MKIFSRFKDIRFLLKPWWKCGKILLVSYGITAVIFAPLASYFSTTLAQAVIDKIQTGRTYIEALTTGLVYMTIALFFSLLKSAFEDLYLRWKKQDVEGHVEREIYKKALQTDFKHFDKPEYFDSYKLTTEEFATQSSAMMENLFSILREVSKFIVYGALIATQGPVLFLIVFFCACFVAYAQIYWSKISVERETLMVNERRKADYLRRLFFDQNAIADMHSSKISTPLLGMFDSSVKSRMDIYKKYGSKELLIDGLVLIAQVGTTFAVPTYVAWGVLAGNFDSIGVYATLIASSLALKETLNALGWWGSQVSGGIAYAKKVRAFFETESTIESTTSGISADQGPFSVVLEHVFYHYPNSDFSLKDINLNISEGSRIAIVGENGAGKTSLTKLLLRLYDADSGVIKINGRPIAQYNTSEIRSKIGVAFQNSRLYALSVRENMESYARADSEHLMHTLADVGLDLDLNSQVTKEFDESGVVLSGGDTQKLCLTRLMHSDFGLLILDEPSSALDPIAEYNLAKLMFDRSPTTTVMIAHRLSTVVNADKIYLLSDGRIVEAGTHEQLMNLNGKYAEMFAKQAEGYLHQ